MRPEQWEGKIIPAQLSFLAIYSPPLGVTDETFKEQVVFYYSRAAKEAKLQSKSKRNRRSRGSDTEDEVLSSREVENEKLRQIGLAQGMVDFARYISEAAVMVERHDTNTSDQAVRAGAFQMIRPWTRSRLKSHESFYTSWSEDGGCWP